MDGCLSILYKAEWVLVGRIHITQILYKAEWVLAGCIHTAQIRMYMLRVCTTCRFLAGGDAERNATFKLIPRIAKGSWIIKQSVGSTPVILGRKLQCTYYRGQLEDSGACYLEVDVDVASSSVAAHVVGLVQVCTVH